MKMKPLIYLDIDGVLNRHRHIHINHAPRIEHDNIEVLNQITRNHKPNFVIISTWARHIEDGEWSLDGFARMLRTHGAIPMNIIGHTAGRFPDPLPGSVPRQESLQRCRFRSAEVLRHQHCRPDQSPWVVLDDMDLQAIPKEHVVRPNPSLGLQPHHIPEVAKLLKEQRA